MIKRLFWLSLGVTVGVLVVRKLTKKAEEYSPRGIARTARSSASGVADTARDFMDDVRERAREREEELMLALQDNGASDVDAVHAEGGRHGRLP